MLSPTKVLDHHYLEARCMLIELAATLDRYDRAVYGESGAGKSGAGKSGAGKSGAGPADDRRLEQLYESLAVLADKGGSADRAERLLQLFSGLE